jgi:hypothetical protein
MVADDTSGMPRIPPLTYEECDDEQRRVWDDARQPRPDGRPRRDTTALMFRTFVHHPALTTVHSPFVQYVKNSTNLPVRQRELAIMRSAWLGGVDDQYVNHTKIALECGLTQEELDRVPLGPDAPGWSVDDAVVLRGVDELHSWCRIGDDTWAALARQYDERQLIEFLLLVGNYRTLSYVQNSVGIRPVTGTTPNIPGNRFRFPAPR